MQKEVTDPLAFLSDRDRALLERTFDIEDPESLPGLADSPPETDDVPEIEFQYDVTPPGGRAAGHKPHLKCVFGHAARHWRGYIVKWSDGTRGRIGIDCGSEHFDFEFKAVEQRFLQARQRAKDLRQLIEIRKALPKALEELRDFRRSPVITAFDQYRRELGHEFGQLLAALRKIADRDGRLETMRRERDHNAEDELAARKAPHLIQDLKDAARKSPGVQKACLRRLKKWKEANAQYRLIGAEIGPLLGREAILLKGTLEGVLEAAAARTEIHARQLLQNTSDYWTYPRTISGALKELRDCLDSLQAVVNALSALNEFSWAANLERIAAWTALEVGAPNPAVNEVVRAEGRTLISESGFELSLPQNFSVPVLPKLDALRKLV